MPDSPRERKRRSPRIDKEEKAKLVERVLRFYEHDMAARNDDIEDRVQRIAKFRMWTEGKNFPWEDSSDVAVPDMMTHSLRVQDTLVNAATSARPPVFPKALQKADKEKQDVVANLTDFQFFIEQPGEDIIGEMADAFVNDGVVTVFTPWIRETREIVDRRRFPPIPDDQRPEDYLSATLLKTFPGVGIEITENIWEYRLQEEDGTSFVSFYTTDDGLEMDIRKEHVVYDGPRALVKEYEDVVYPPRAKNLQMPSPSNPGGALHVILVDYPTTDEIRRLAKSKFYTVSKEDLDGLDQIPK
ncbi:MAG TPA: hypothetical protein ENH84_07650, partial [Phycisphaerae bacterium]|nr:hypothetical protein [Phycisphaerae bacterium]